MSCTRRYIYCRGSLVGSYKNRTGSCRMSCTRSYRILFKILQDAVGYLVQDPTYIVQCSTLTLARLPACLGQLKISIGQVNSVQWISCTRSYIVQDSSRISCTRSYIVQDLVGYLVQDPAGCLVQDPILYRTL